MVTLSDELEQRSVRQKFFARLLLVTRRQIADISEVVALDRVSRERDRHLIEHPLIDESSLARRVRVFVGDERLAEELTHFAVDLSRAKIAVIQENLEPRRRHLIVVR